MTLLKDVGKDAPCCAGNDGILACEATVWESSWDYVRRLPLVSICLHILLEVDVPSSCQIMLSKILFDGPQIK